MKTVSARSKLGVVAIVAAGMLTVGLLGCNTSGSTETVAEPKDSDRNASTQDVAPSGPQTIVLAGGCFWCTEAVFERLEGVEQVVSGYAGGKRDDASYNKVLTGLTDHAEAIEITYDPSVISYEKILEVFFTTAHDPTQKDRQGPDVGRQYRSAIFYATEQQKQVASAYIEQLDGEGIYSKPIVTTLEPLDAFYPAEEYHQDYVDLNPYNPYVWQTSLPKVRKTCERFPELVKEEKTNDSGSE